jgi:hypothetical protein
MNDKELEEIIRQLCAHTNDPRPMPLIEDGDPVRGVFDLATEAAGICEDVYEVDYVGDGKIYTVGEAATELICGFYRWEKPGFGAPVVDPKSVAGPSAETFFRRFGIMGNRKLA